MTHYVPGFGLPCPDDASLVMAACATFVPRESFSTEPDCQTCQGWLACDPLTHYAPFDYVRERGKGKHAEFVAVCDRWIQKALFSSEPTCPECQAWITADEADADSIDSAPDPLTDYAERRR